MRIQIVTPAAEGSLNGNRRTADRWADAVRTLGHDVRITTHDDGQGTDLLLALHAYRSADCIRAFRERAPDRPIVLALTGTDVYRDQFTHPDVFGSSLLAADALIGLHDRVGDDLPPSFHNRLVTVHQSAAPPPGADDTPPPGRFEVCVIGHLRDEKDPFRAAQAVRNLPDASRIRIIHAGRAYSEDWAARARQEMGVNPRYTWLDQVDHDRIRELMARSGAMVISSVMEGGANVVSEACVAGLPVIASHIPGNIGLLGEDYPGYFPVRDTAALRQLLLRIEDDEAFLQQLRDAVGQRAHRFTPEAERKALQQAMDQALSRMGSSASP
ncbi:putative glycosyltransferase (TIGR04348 family) [Tamilnaduibacter salinus]|uniref:Putative glycosyltransferase (TIGR04348 family) n=1 Tax=Tamilnaduibacter salinus TaxID=1484056 RepID=A0A2A2I484_9GAMM|nr:selenoneine biosynthesis selenosugar synthase SenB [Tamilnaduibacter salinus]PAV26402.1 TIGR04348 family glycosyltransferase [Tamilnaduibacter salinus]PVY78160.1 putative glycosyltransferase (TIGR04348 family) [Tamilnaduibacter salinus]